MIDSRKNTQSFANCEGRRIYCWRDKGVYSVGINGTSQHYSGLTKHQAEDKINELYSYKGEKWVFNY